MTTEQRILELTRSKLSYKLLNLHIFIRQILYGREHNKTKQLVFKRKIIDCQSIQDYRSAQRYHQLLRGEVKLLNSKRLEEGTNKELDKILHNEG